MLVLYMSIFNMKTNFITLGDFIHTRLNPASVYNLAPRQWNSFQFDHEGYCSLYSSPASIDVIWVTRLVQHVYICMQFRQQMVFQIPQGALSRHIPRRLVPARGNMVYIHDNLKHILACRTRTAIIHRQTYSPIKQVTRCHPCALLTRSNPRIIDLT